MKKKIYLFIFSMALIFCSSCSNLQKNSKGQEPEISQAKAICELATMDCYYHNVAKYYEEDASGILWWKKDKDFWIEYAGVVTVGIDASRVSIQVDNNKVTISLPSVKVLGCKVDESLLTKDSFYVAEDSAKITADDQTAAFAQAQINMKETAEKDTTLLANAQERVQRLLEDYVNNIGECTGRDYVIEWVYLDDNSGNNEDSHEKDNSSTESSLDN